MARSSGGLTRWFKEKWVDVKTGKPCGRQKAKNEVIQLVDQVSVYQVRHLRLAGEMSAAEKTRFKREKTAVRR